MAQGERLPARVRILAVLVVVAGVVLVVAGVGTWFVVQAQLADEKITVSRVGSSRSSSA